MTYALSNSKGLIFDIQIYSIHYGPGTRTLIFFKGCRLRCEWCSNPESWSPHSQLMFDESSCVSCGAESFGDFEKLLSFLELALYDLKHLNYEKQVVAVFWPKHIAKFFFKVGPKMQFPRHVTLAAKTAGI